MTVDFSGIAYAVAVAAGGILGYVKSNSIPSLGAGLLFGSILGYGAYQTSQNPDNDMVLLRTSAVLGSLMGYRFYMTRKMMPAGIVTIISTAMVVKLLIRRITTSTTSVKVE